MTLAQLKDRALELAPSDRLRLAEVIWDSLESEPTPFTLTDAQRALLDRRLSDVLAHPEDALTWPEVQARLDKR